MEDFDDELDMDTLAELLDADDPEIDGAITTGGTACQKNSQSFLESISAEAAISSSALGLDMSDDDNDESQEGASDQMMLSKSASSSASGIDNESAPPSKNVALESVDPLERELRQMEAKMAALKAELAKKKKLNVTSSDGCSRIFTKLTIPTVSKETQRKLSMEEHANLLKSLKEQKNRSLLHGGDTDSEDDEDNKNPFESRYNSYGHALLKNLKSANNGQSSSSLNGRTNLNPGSSAGKDGGASHQVLKSDNFEVLKALAAKRQQVVKKIKNDQNWQEASGSLVPAGGSLTKMTPAEKNAVRCAYSGIFVVSPQVSASQMQERMEGRRFVSFSTIPLQMRGGEIEGDWVTIAVLVAKTPPKTSQKGTQYSVWQLTDLRDCTKTVGLFLFSGAHSGLWKTTVGSVVAILNAQIMKDRQGDSSSNLVTLSINNAMNLMLMGTARDLGWCKGRTKANASCRQFVNKSVCEFCVFHVQREYQKTSSKRADLQSSFSARGPQSSSLKQKVLGKDKVFYGGNLFTGAPLSAPSIPGRQNTSHRAKDLATLSSLKLKMKSDQLKDEDKKNSFVLKHLSQKEVSVVQNMVKENDSLGERLLAPTPGARNLLRYKAKDDEAQLQETRKANGLSKLVTAKDLLKMTHSEIQQRKIEQAKRKSLTAGSASSIPTLGRGLCPGQLVDFDLSPPSKSAFDPVKAKALAILKRKGEALQPSEKNSIRSKDKVADPQFQDRVQKRLRESGCPSGSDEEATCKKQKQDEESRSLLGSVDLNNEKIQAMLERKSKHSNLVDDVENAQMDKYYSKLEYKEKLEEKLASTMEVPTNAVVCIKCKYQAVLQSQFCKDQGHVVKAVKASKRFFECSKCKKRTVTLEKMPVKSCGNCEQTSWRRVAMGKEKKGPVLDSEVLCLRGNEQKHFGGCAEKAFLHIDG
ncbi:protein MCM10 homolog isoform X2 [Hyalella azteca]|nr:protein MCM10 homolog isoform X2 [Hyalella azteca]XP_047739088.1 protein MCM10 homolog isoform X2 [Hyalella azteca]